MPTHLRTTHVLFGQPSTILQSSGATEPVDLGDLASLRHWMSDSATPASFLRGNVCKTNIMAESCGESYALDAI